MTADPDFDSVIYAECADLDEVAAAFAEEVDLPVELAREALVLRCAIAHGDAGPGLTVCLSFLLIHRAPFFSCPVRVSCGAVEHRAC